MQRQLLVWPFLDVCLLNLNAFSVGAASAPKRFVAVPPDQPEHLITEHRAIHNLAKMLDAYDSMQTNVITHLERVGRAQQFICRLVDPVSEIP